MGPESDTRFSPFANLRIKGNGLRSKFDPGKLPNSELTQLWKIAARKDLEELCETIEEELMKRGNETKI